MDGKISTEQMGRVGIYEQVDVFIDFLKRTGRKESTCRTTRYDLVRLLKILEAAGRPTRAEEITIDDLQYLKSAMQVKDTVAKSNLRLVSRFCAHFTGQDLEKMAGILYNRESIDRKFISLGQFKMMLRNADPNMRAALLLGSMMGLRRAEICNARWKDISCGKLHIYGKGHGKGLEANMEIPEPVMQAIIHAKEYRSTTGIEDPDDDHLVQGLQYGVWGGLCVAAMSKKVSDLGKLCCVDVTTHSLRRLFASTLYNEVEVDPNTLKTLMRHSDISVTYRCYINADPVRCRKAQDNLEEVMKGYF